VTATSRSQRALDNALVIGAGFLGTHVVRRLRAEDVAVRVLTRSPVELDKRRRLGTVELVVSDASVHGIVGPALDDVDHVFYCAGGLMPAQSNLDPATDAALALPPLLRVLEELRDRPAIGLTFLSSGGTVYGNPSRLPVEEDHPTEPVTSYGIMKLASEKYVLMYRRLYGIPARILRCANVYGAYQPDDRGQGFVATALRRLFDGDPITLFGDGLNVRDYVYAADVADVMVRLARHRDDIAVLNVGSGRGITVRDLLAQLERVVEREPVLAWQPDRGFDVREVVLDIARLQDLLAFAPTSLEDGLSATASAYAPRR
jgi:UDP-glucose 4-epimerase